MKSLKKQGGWIAALAAAAPIIGAGLSGLFGRSSAKKSIGFQREMAQNAHQYEVEDLRKAGLNPILSGTGGRGASASGGAMPSTPDFASAFAMSAKLAAEVANIKANTKLTENKADLIGPTSAVASDAEKLYEWVKKGAPATAKALTRLISSYPGELTKGLAETYQSLKHLIGKQKSGKGLGTINVNPKY